MFSDNTLVPAQGPGTLDILIEGGGTSKSTYFSSKGFTVPQPCSVLTNCSDLIKHGVLGTVPFPDGNVGTT